MPVSTPVAASKSADAAEERSTPWKSSTAPLLVASDGSESADNAVWAGKLIAQKSGRQVHVIAVHEPLPLMSPEVQMAATPDDSAHAREALRAVVREQLVRAKLPRQWPMEVVSGEPAHAIASAAERLGADLVIMGLGEHGMYERVLGDEMVLRVIRLGRVPVLAVGPGFVGLPTRIVGATDFSASSARAIELAASLSGQQATLMMTHVMSPDLDDANWSRENAAFHGTVGRAFDLLASDITGDVHTDRTLLSGDPAKVLIHFADNFQADLVATGSHGHGFLSRLWLGSVSQRLVRGVRCSVLVAPPREGPSYVDELPEVTTRFASYEWAERLEEFTRRNVGRRTTLEVIDPSVGAQVEERTMPLLGADFDPRDGHVHVMLGDSTLEGRHLTRTIRGVTAVQVLRDRHGLDLMLRVAHGAGQTLLTFER